MARIVILYGTTDGQTRRIAQHVADGLVAEGVETTVVDAAAAPADFSFAGADAAVIAGSVRMGKHQRALTRIVRAHAAELAQIPSAFLSVSLSAAHDTEPARREVRKCIKKFLDDTRWTPDSVLPVAGALVFSRYGFFLKRVMRFLSRVNGGDTDMSRDYEYTDWNQLTGFAQGLARSLRVPASERAAALAEGAPAA